MIYTAVLFRTTNSPEANVLHTRLVTPTHLNAILLALSRAFSMLSLFTILFITLCTAIPTRSETGGCNQAMPCPGYLGSPAGAPPVGQSPPINTQPLPPPPPSSLPIDAYCSKDKNYRCIRDNENEPFKIEICDLGSWKFMAACGPTQTCTTSWGTRRSGSVSKDRRRT
ncbi:hypothetical protein Micbo1qcDRAFT_177044 [Microdochium bolleyi]|uniref:Uncharacterized protein n=1 Tax=Microdochium bolleyi TaxID=196109 RepID=A0A136IXY5_9PEZI|nr:hypothetical protein Micbo1qcDRAFT_177044 [Microdochium bolleyi]